MSGSQFHTSFSKETWEQFKADQRSGPIHMLNLIRLRDQANYSDGRTSTGAEAYKKYSEVSAPVFQELGGNIIWRGGHEMTMIGPSDENWDVAFIAEYPSVEAFLNMMRDATYRGAMVNRQAAVVDSRLVRFHPGTSGSGFAG